MFEYQNNVLLFDSYICSMLHYGCKVWGNHNAHDIEKLHLDLTKYVLGVKRTTTTSLLRIVTGRPPNEWKLLEFFLFLNFGSSWYKQMTLFWKCVTTSKTKQKLCCKYLGKSIWKRSWIYLVWTRQPNLWKIFTLH